MERMTEPIKVWDADMGEWRTVTVEVTAGPVRTTRRIPPVGVPYSPTVDALSDTRPGTPESLPGSDYEWAYTAYAPGDGFADMRSHVDPPMMHPHTSHATAAPESDSNPSPARVARWAAEARHEKTSRNRKNRKDVR